MVITVVLGATAADWFGTTVDRLGFVVAGTALMYLSTITAVRVAGRRTVAQLSAFDFVVTVAIGSVVATTVVSPDPSYAEGMAALVTLLTLQVIFGALRQRSPFARRWLDFPPERVVERGEICMTRGALGHQMTDTELRSKLRQLGVFDLTVVEEAILEPDGGVSIRLRPR